MSFKITITIKNVRNSYINPRISLLLTQFFSISRSPSEFFSFSCSPLFSVVKEFFITFCSQIPGLGASNRAYSSFKDLKKVFFSDPYFFKHRLFAHKNLSSRSLSRFYLYFSIFYPIFGSHQHFNGC